MSFWKSQYTRHLEEENSWLRKQLEDAMKALSPRLEQVQVRADALKAPLTAGDIVAHKKKHLIERFTGGASCACGWKTKSKEPEEIQTEIATHYREFSPQQRTAPARWPAIRNRLEQEEA